MNVMKYLDFLKCEQFTNDVFKFYTCSSTGEQTLTDVDFDYVTDELIHKLCEFFLEVFNIKIVEVANDPPSYKVYNGKTTSEYYCSKTMFTELIEIIYGYTTD